MTPPHPLSIPNFRYYWVARLAATLAQGAMMLIIGWQVYNLARDAGMSAPAPNRTAPQRTGQVSRR